VARLHLAWGGDTSWRSLVSTRSTELVPVLRLGIRAGARCPVPLEPLTLRGLNQVADFSVFPLVTQSFHGFRAS